MDLIYGIPEWMLNKQEKPFSRLKTQTLGVGQQYIVDGIAFTTNWVELAVSNLGSRYAAFDVPSGYKMALDFRLLNTSSEKAWYHVYTEGAYTLGASKPNDSTGFVKTRNLRQDSTFTPTIATRYNVSSAPTRITDSIIDEPVFGIAGSASGNKASGNLAPENTYFLLDGGQQFLLQIYNGGAGNLDMQVALNYAFIPENLISPLEV